MLWVPLSILIETAYRRVVPLYSFDDRERPYLSASAVPFESHGVRFLITAAHCSFREGRPVPLFVYGEKRLHALRELRGAWQYTPGQSPDLDIAVIGLEPDCADDLQDRHWFCGPNDVGSVFPRTPGIHYLIVGYPSSRNRRRPPRYGLPSRATALVTGDVCSVEAVRGVDKTQELHFGIALPHRKVPTLEGREFHVPRPYGMSGGGVWRVEIDTSSRFAGRPYLVGIGVEYHSPQRTFVATRVQAAAPLAADLANPKTPRTFV